MKITNAQIAGELSRPEMFLRVYGRLLSITALTTNADEANAHMLANEGESLLGEHAGFCFIARHADKGTEPCPLSDLARELVRALRESTPGEITAAARMLDDLGTDMGGANAGERKIARLLAPLVHKLRK